MSLSNLTSVSAWTDYAALTPAAMNLRLSEITTNLAQLNSDQSLTNTFDPRTYGAVPGAESTTAIQAAIDAAGVSGGVVPIDFSYTVTRQSTGVALSQPYSNVAVRGSPGGTLVLTPTAAVTSVIQVGLPISTPSLRSNVEVRGLRIDASGSSEVKGIRVSYCQGFDISSNEVWNIGDGAGSPAGIWLEGVDSSQSCTDFVVRDNYVHDIGGLTGLTGDGIEAQYVARGVIAGNRTMNTNRGIFLQGPVADVSVEGNSVVSSNDNGIRLNPVSGGRWDDLRFVTVANNVIDRATRDGIRANGAYLTITGNSITSVQQRGIKADLCAHTVFSNNNIYRSGQQGIYLSIALESAMSGVHQNVLIHGNSVNSVGQEGIRVDGSGFTGNVPPALAKHITISNNNVAFCAAGGIMVQDTDEFLVLHNHAARNANTLSSSSKAGILISMSTGTHMLLGGRVMGNRCWDDRATGMVQGQGILVQATVAGSVVSGLVLDGNDVSDSPILGVNVDVSPTGTINPVVCINTMAANCPASVTTRASDITNSTFTTRAGFPETRFPSLVDGSAILPSLAYVSDRSLGFYRSGVSTVALSFGTLNLATGNVRFSIATYSAANLLAHRELGVVMQASGLSLIYRSNDTAYVVGQSAQSATA